MTKYSARMPTVQSFIQSTYHLPWFIVYKNRTMKRSNLSFKKPLPLKINSSSRKYCGWQNQTISKDLKASKRNCFFIAFIIFMNLTDYLLSSWSSFFSSQSHKSGCNFCIPSLICSYPIGSFFLQNKRWMIFFIMFTSKHPFWAKFTNTNLTKELN